MTSSLIEAALLDQARRVLETPPSAFRESRAWTVKKPDAAPRSCSVCAGRVASWNSAGICSRTAKCRAARTRWAEQKRKQAHP